MPAGSSFKPASPRATSFFTSRRYRNIPLLLTIAAVSIGGFMVGRNSGSHDLGLDAYWPGHEESGEGSSQAGAGAGVFGAGHGKQSHPHLHKLHGLNGIPCNPNDQYGWPNPWDHHWQTPNPECPGEDFGGKMMAMDPDDLWDAFPEFRNKSVLFSGDSVGRQMFETLCQIGHAKIVAKGPPGFEKVQYGNSSTCEVPGLGMRFAQIHTYGLANTSDPYVLDIVSRSYPGGKDFDLQSRAKRFFETSLSDFKPDYIQLNGGPWDFRYWFVRDILEKKRYEDLPREDAETSAAMAVVQMDFYKNMFPDLSKVWYVHGMMMNETDGAVRKIVGEKWMNIKKGETLPDSAYPPYYSYRRQAVYRAIMKTRLEESEYDSLDYGQIQLVMSPKDFYKDTDLVHPQYKAKRTMANMILTMIARNVRYGV
ncbi:hypothetical protein IAT40_007402 [Kwoniella sp. CBS 6097]